MPVELVAEEEFHQETPRLRLVPPVDPEPVAVAPPAKPIDEQMLQVLGMLAQVLAVRAMLLLSALGVFILSWRAMSTPTPMSLLVVALFAVSTIGPLAWLAGRGKS